MANQEHLHILRQGVEVWNEWMENSSDINSLGEADLSHADLREMNLSRIILNGVNLHGADLTDADLSEANARVDELQGGYHGATPNDALQCPANLHEAILTRANLSKAHLQMANLQMADLSWTTFDGTELSWANLSGADLRHAHLERTLLYSANLQKANLTGAYLIGNNFSKANFSDAIFDDGITINGVVVTSAYFAKPSSIRVKTPLSSTNLVEANFSNTNLSGVSFIESNLSAANLSGSDLSSADFDRANLSDADLSGVNLRGANLSRATLIGTNLQGADLNGCSIYGISVWNVQLDDADQSNLSITLPTEPTITVDNLEVAQFIYLLLNNKKIRDVIDTITSKVVLILGRFTDERKVVLDAIRDELRKRNYSPVLFDFEKPTTRNITETVSTLAHLARFVIADITEPKSIPQELSHIIPFLPSVPIVPLLYVAEREYGMYEHFVSYPWVQPVNRYHDVDELLHSIQERIIDPAEQKVRELAIEKAKRLERL